MWGWSENSALLCLVTSGAKRTSRFQQPAQELTLGLPTHRQRKLISFELISEAGELISLA